MQIRPYQSDDKKTCLAIFDSNLPKFFAAEERPDFADFLDKLPCPYFVIQDGDEILGCGGHSINEAKQKVGMAWGMIHSEQHKRGLGRYLLLYRLKTICKIMKSGQIILDTSQHSYPFFEKLGFLVDKITENTYGDGLHQYDMTLELDEAANKRIQEQFVFYSAIIDKNSRSNVRLH